MAALDAFPPYRRLDHRFHLTVASAARSPRLVAAETQVQADLAKLLRLIPESAEMLHVSNEQHRELVAAIRNRAAGRARAVMPSTSSWWRRTRRSKPSYSSAGIWRVFHERPHCSHRQRSP